MKITISRLLNGAKQSTDLTVIIDVFRAFSEACYLLNNGAEKIISVDDINLAYKLDNDNPDYILIGERGGKKPKGFDYNNSPTEIEHVDFLDKTIIHTTSAGTQGLVNAKNADILLAGSFVNVQATINYIKKQNPKKVTLVAMGSSGTISSEEDELCAEYIKNGLQNKKNNFDKIYQNLKKYKSAEKFFDPNLNWAPQRDFELCMALDRFNFAIRAELLDKNQKILKKVDF